MISFPHAKINLGLSIVSKRSDGFHNLETVFYPLPIRDVLEIVPSEEISFIPSGLNIPGKSDQNLVMSAFLMMKKKFPQIQPLEIHLYKAIPTGAGLGGGSSDAAEMIKMIIRFFGPGISADSLPVLALELGSDCPFFMQSNPCFATGRGEILEPVALDLSNYSFLLIHPEIRISTAWAFSKISPAPSKINLKEILLKPIESWEKNVQNDFEAPVFDAHPSLKIIKDRLYQAGALYASMTGSGSTIYGIFPKNKVPEILIENTEQTLIG